MRAISHIIFGSGVSVTVSGTRLPQFQSMAESKMVDEGRTKDSWTVEPEGYEGQT